jgi:HTH-type transcriptional regulator/antitoxin MqsA
MRYQKHDDVLVYKDRTRTIRTLGWWCTKCEEAILSAEPLVAHERAFQQLKAEVAEVAKIRTALGLGQRKVGELLGGSPRAFQKYESGKQALSVPMSHLLRLLACDPSRLRELGGPMKTKVPSIRHRRRVEDHSASG